MKATEIYKFLLLLLEHFINGINKLLEYKTA